MMTIKNIAPEHDRITLCLFIDALGWEIIKDADFLNDLLPFRYRLRTVLGYSCAAQPTILTGLPPDRHGHWAMYYFDKHPTSFSWLKPFGILPPPIKDHWRFRRQLMKIHRTLNKFTGYYNLYTIPFQYFRQLDICEKKDIYAPEAFEQVESIFDLMHRKRIHYKVWNWRFDPEQSFRELSACLEELQSYDVLFLYTSWMDSYLHQFRKNLEKVHKGIGYIECLCRRLIEKASRHYKSVDIALFSDHGMNQVYEHVDIRSNIQRLPVSEGMDYIPFYDATMIRFLFNNDKARDTITDYLQKQSLGQIIDKEELMKEGVYFSDNRYGELVFLLKDGTIILPSFMGKWLMHGMHGFHPNTADAYAVLLTNFTPAYTPAHISDIHDIILQQIPGIQK